MGWEGLAACRLGDKARRRLCRRGTQSVSAARGCEALPGLRSLSQSNTGGLWRIGNRSQSGNARGSDHDDRRAARRSGRFAGPAVCGSPGKLLDKCLEEAQIDRRKVYVTNTVKHFRWEPRGKVRIHKKPSMREIRACRPWLDAELEAIRPRLIVCLGAVAAQSLLGTSFRITQSHGEIQTVAGLPPILATSHPSAILRASTSEDRERGTQLFLEDLRKAADYVAS